MLLYCSPDIIQPLLYGTAQIGLGFQCILPILRIPHPLQHILGILLRILGSLSFYASIIQPQELSAGYGLQTTQLCLDSLPDNIYHGNFICLRKIFTHVLLPLRHINGLAHPVYEVVMLTILLVVFLRLLPCHWTKLEGPACICVLPMCLRIAPGLLEGEC